MQRKILINLLIVSLCGIILTTVAIYTIQTFMAHNTANVTALSRLEDVTERIRQNQTQIDELVAALKDDYLSRARALAMMIELDPDIIDNRDKLDDVVRALNVDEVHIIDENGILKWGTQPQYYGLDFNSTDQTRPFLAILDDPSLEVAQDLMPNGSVGLMCQYSGVSLRNGKGIAQVGMYPERLKEALKNNQIDNVLGGISVGNTGYVFSISEGKNSISAHPNSALVDTVFTEPLQETGFMTIDGQRVLYNTLSFDHQLLVAVIPTSELYAQRAYYTLIYMIFTIAVFGAISAIVSGYIKRNFVNGILDTVSTLQEISAGNLNVVANIRSNEEFEKLSDGINHMLLSITSKIDEVAALADNLNRYGAIISTSGAGVIIKDKDGLITDWNIGAQNILGYSPEEAIGRTSNDIYVDHTQYELVEDMHRRIAQGETIADVDLRGIHKNGKTIICSTSLSPILDSQGEVSGSIVIFRDITSERQAELKARNLAAIVSIADAGIIIKDKYGLVQEWNIGAENILGYSAEEIIGNPTEYYAPNSAHVALNDVERGLMQGQHITHVEVVRKHKCGQLIDCSASYTPIFDSNGEYAGSIAVFHDISDKKRMEHQLQDAVIASEAASKAKTVFLANMSHEIRTPMNGVIGFTELALDDDTISQKTRDYLNKIQLSAEGLLQIINAVLDISKIESGKVDVEKIPFSIQEVFKQCETIEAPRAAENGIVLYPYVDKLITTKLLGDPTKLRQVLLNLLSNAVKFTKKGMIKLIAVVEKSSEDSVTIRFEVQDNGIGMTPEQLEKIFDPFMQADASTTRKYGGTGLGLPIAKKIIGLMGGELTVESVKGVGSKFSFSIEFEIYGVNETPVMANHKQEPIEKPTFKGDILVCEDNTINQQVIHEHLSRIGLNVTIVENGKAGVRAVQERMDSGNPYDLIFMDIHMPIMDGLEASKNLMRIGNYTPIIALTANAMSTDKEVYLSSGMSGYLMKPFTARELWICVLEYLTPVATVDNVSQKEKSATSASSAIINRQLGIEQVAGNNELYESILTGFARDNNTILDKINSAIAAGDIKMAHRLAHTLKGLAGLIGAMELKNTAKVIEESLSGGKADFTYEQMKNLESELNAVMNELAPIIAKNEIIEEPAGDLEKQAALDLIKILEPLLEVGNSKCLQHLSDMKKVFAPLRAQGALLISQIEDYDFELAYKTLKEIKHTLEQ